MRIAYITNTRFPTEKAHGHQIAQVCHAMSTFGHEITLIAPGNRRMVADSASAYYAIPNSSFAIKRLPCFNALAHPLIPNVLAFEISMWSYRRVLRAYLQKSTFDLLYIRAPALLSISLQTAIPVVIELHTLPGSRKRSFVHYCNQCRRVVCLTSPMRDKLIIWGVRPELLTIEGDAVDLQRFTGLLSTEEAKQQWNLLPDATVIGYVGRLKTMGMEKGIRELIKAFHILRTRIPNLFLLIVGGPESDCEEYKNYARGFGLTQNDVRFTGEIPAKDIPSALAACDILTMPFPDLPHYRTNMSPLKMFEYMATGKPIVTSDLPPIRDILNEESAIFCAPGDREDLAEKIQWTLKHSTEATKRAQQARRIVEKHTWTRRMQRILSTT